MIPLTEGTLALVFAGRPYLHDIGVLIVNRDRAQLIEAVRYKPDKLDDMFLAPIDPRAKDLTSQIQLGFGDRLRA